MNASDFASAADAISAVKDGGTVKFSSSDVVDAPLEISKSVRLSANGATFTQPIKVTGGNVGIMGANLVCSAASTAAKNNAPAVTVTGDGDFSLENCRISGTSRTGLSIGTTGHVLISGNTIDGGSKKIYNAIEFSINSGADISNAEISNNVFNGTFANNGISLYNLAEGAQIDIKGNLFDKFSVDSNCVRLSNPKNVSAAFNLLDNKYNYTSETPNKDGYTAFLILEDYSKAGSKQDFTKFTINVSNLVRNGNKLSARGDGIDKTYYVFDDKSGILGEGVNDPVVNFI